MALDLKRVDSTLLANYGSFGALISALGSTPTSLLIPINIDLETDTVVMPSNIDLNAMKNDVQFSNGTLMISKMTARPHHRIFSSNMIVTFNYPAIVLPEWWGAATGIDSTDAIQKAINAIYSSGGTLLMYLSTYTISGSLVNNNTINIIDLTDSIIFNKLSPDTFTKGFNLSGFVSNGNIKLTPEGGIAVRVYNGSGTVLPEGYMCTSSSSDLEGVIICNIDEAYSNGIVYSDIANSTYGWLVTHGKCKAYFDTDGSTMGYYFRVPRSDDSSPVNGRAHSESLDIIDEQRKKGYVLQTRLGAGLATVQILW